MATKKKTEAKASTPTYFDVKERATCCGKIYVSFDKPISECTCKVCKRKLTATKIPYVVEVK